MPIHHHHRLIGTVASPAAALPYRLIGIDIDGELGLLQRLDDNPHFSGTDATVGTGLLLPPPGLGAL